jgi:hypothetical protein
VAEIAPLSIVFGMLPVPTLGHFLILVCLKALCKIPGSALRSTESSSL